MSLIAERTADVVLRAVVGETEEPDLAFGLESLRRGVESLVGECPSIRVNLSPRAIDRPSRARVDPSAT